MTRKTWIVLLTVATAFIHLVLLNIGMVKAFGRIDVLFTLNGLGYLGLLAAYLLPFPGSLGALQQRFHGLLCWVLMGFTAVTILAWLAIGDKSLPAGGLGYITQVIQLGLIAALWGDK